MKNILIVFLLCSGIKTVAQDVGINVATATRARLEVIGVAGSGATAGAFGTDGAGISLQRNWPTIGFNQYRDITTAGSQGKFMSNGFAAIQYFDINSGIMAIDMFASGAANNFTPGGARGITIFPNGNVAIKSGVSFATLTVPRGDGNEGTAVFAGTQLWSHFNYSTDEGTYIRAGVDNSNVYINKIPSGDVYLGVGDARIGINNYSPTATIDLIQPTSVNAITITDYYGKSWHQKLDHTNISGHGDGVMLGLYYGINNMGRFQYWDGQYQALSDRRFKTKIEDLPGVLDKINLLNPVVYEMKANNSKHQKSYGFIAQEVKQLFPHLIHVINTRARSGEGINDLHTMNYSGLGVLAIKALQEQHAEINDLQKEYETLMQRLENLEQKVSKN